MHFLSNLKSESEVCCMIFFNAAENEAESQLDPSLNYITAKID